MSKFNAIDRHATRPLLGINIMYPNPTALAHLGADWDWIWIDAQHGSLDYRDVVDLIRMADLMKRPTLVRIPAQDPGWVGRVLDAGAAGVIVPLVENVEQAQAMVSAAKFPGVGNRSYGGRRVIDRLGRDYYKSANRETVLILQIESNEAVARADAIVAVDGVDGLFLGPDDLLLRSGYDVNAPKNETTLGGQYRHIAECCRRRGKLTIGHGVDEVTAGMAKAYGFDLVVGASDVNLLARNSRATVEKLRRGLGLSDGG